MQGLGPNKGVSTLIHAAVRHLTRGFGLHRGVPGLLPFAFCRSRAVRSHQHCPRLKLVNKLPYSQCGWVISAVTQVMGCIWGRGLWQALWEGAQRVEGSLQTALVERFVLGMLGEHCGLQAVYTQRDRHTRVNRQETASRKLSFARTAFYNEAIEKKTPRVICLTQSGFIQKL